MTYEMKDAFYRVVELLKEAPEYVAVDTETDGLFPYKGNRLIGISFYFPHVDESYYLPFRHADGENLPLEYLEVLNNYWNYPGTTYLMFNAKFDLHMFYVDGFKDLDHVLDVMVAAHTVNENEAIPNGGMKIGDDGRIAWRLNSKGAYQMKRLARVYLGAEYGAGEDELFEIAQQKGIDAKSQMALLNWRDVRKYAELDTIITWKLYEFYWPHLERWQQVDLFYYRCDLETKVAFRMERNGFPVSVYDIEHAILNIQADIKSAQNEVNNYARAVGLPGLNPRSHQQIKHYFALNGINIASTNKKTLERMDGGDNPAAQALLRLRNLENIVSKFYSPYLKMVSSDGRLHASFNIIGTVTGRPSSDNPNLQQVPRISTSPVKKVFRVPYGWTLFSIDYKQLELRIAAHYAKCGQMIQMFNDGIDMHQVTADNLTELTGHKVSRSLGKNTNFGLIYGMGGRRFAREHNIDEDFATQIVKGWNALYPEFSRALATCKQIVSEPRNPDGSKGGKYNFIRLWDNYVRRFHLHLKYNLDGQGDYYLKDAWNSVVQGTAVSVASHSMLKACQIFDDDTVLQPLAHVHDSFVFLVKDEHISEVVPVVKMIMEDWDDQFNPPLRVDVEFSKFSWGEMEKWQG